MPDDWDFKLVDWNYWRHDDIEIKDMPKLEEAYVSVVSSVLKSVIGSITSVKHLTICSEVIRGFFHLILFEVFHSQL